MKRHPALTGLSREHHAALVLANRARRAAADPQLASELLATLCMRWTAEIEPHFQQEEQTLLPMLEAAGEGTACARTRAEHDQLRQLAAQLLAGEAQALPDWGAALEQHVRFEERELFPLAEQSLTDVQLAVLMAEDKQ